MADAGCRSAFLGYKKVPGNICISVNDEVVHGIGATADPIRGHRETGHRRNS